MEEKTCGVWVSDGPCGRGLRHNYEHCIFHSKDIEGKKAEFDDLFWEEFERQDKKGGKRVFPQGVAGAKFTWEL